MNIGSKIALVTGASSGIGEATAERLALAGYKVSGTSGGVPKAGRRSFELLPLDVTSDESVAAAVGEVVRRNGRIDLLVNNAGFSVAPAGAEESSTGQARSIFDTNFFGIVRMTRAVVPHMRQQGSGRIINIGSVLGFLPAPYMALYSATKHAVEGYSESLDHELRTRGIRVSVIEPAYTKTQFDDRYPDAPRAQHMVERFRIAFDRVLGRGIKRHVRCRQEAQHGTDIDDATAPLEPHVRHNGSRHPHDPEEVRIENRSRLLDGALFRSGGGDTEARVVHEQVDAALRAQHFPDGGFDGFIAGHVEGQ